MTRILIISVPLRLLDIQAVVCETYISDDIHSEQPNLQSAMKSQSSGNIFGVNAKLVALEIVEPMAVF